MVQRGETGGLSEKVSLQNFRSVISLLKVGDLEVRWGNGESDGDENLDDIGRFVSRNGLENVSVMEHGGVRELLQRRHRRKRGLFGCSHRSRDFSEDENSVVARAITELDVPASSNICQVVNVLEK